MRTKQEVKAEIERRLREIDTIDRELARVMNESSGKHLLARMDYWQSQRHEQHEAINALSWVIE